MALSPEFCFSSQQAPEACRGLDALVGFSQLPEHISAAYGGYLSRTTHKTYHTLTKTSQQIIPSTLDRLPCNYEDCESIQFASSLLRTGDSLLVGFGFLVGSW